MKLISTISILAVGLLSFVYAEETPEPTRTADVPTTSINATINDFDIEPRQQPAWTVICETSDGSPFRPHVSPIVNLMTIELKDQKCVQTKIGGNHCTKMQRFSSASFDICGTPMSNMACGTAGRALDELNTKCRKVINDIERVGGYIDFGDVTLVLYSEERTTN